MKCDFCNGYGSYADWISGVSQTIMCHVCDGTGEITDSPVTSEESDMNAKLTKGTKAPPAAKPKAVLSAVNINDNQDDSFTVHGVDANGSVLDISALATITASSDNTALMTVDAPVGVTSTVHGVVPSPAPADGTVLGVANLVIVATWNDGSVGPFNISVPVTLTYSASAPTGIVVDFGTPVIRP